MKYSICTTYPFKHRLIELQLCYTCDQWKVFPFFSYCLQGWIYVADKKEFCAEMFTRWTSSCASPTYVVIAQGKMGKLYDDITVKEIEWV